MVPCLAQDPQVWQIGTDDTPDSSNEFGAPSGANEPPPGSLSVVDDDFYTKGTYPAGFNGLTAQRVLASDEPPSQWERSLTSGDRTNRFHFVLTSAQVAPESRGRLSMDLFGGSAVSNSVNLGFGSHIVIANFKTASGQITRIASNVVDAPAKLITTFSIPYAGAAAGPNTIEIIRTGVDAAGTTQSIQMDFVKLEVDAGGNTPPEPVPVPTQYVDETTPFNLVLQTLDSDTPPNEIIYTPLSVPPGLIVYSFGNVSWTPTESQGGASYVVTYRVTDAGIPKMMATNSFTIVVNEVNSPPTTTSIATQTLDEGTTLSLGIVASDSDLPAQTLSYSIISAPSGVAVSSSGVLTWTPTEAQGPSTNTVAIRITDSGSPPLSITNQFTVRVLEVPTAPVLASVPNQTVNENTTFTYTLSASDADLPPNTLTFALVSGPTGLTVSSAGVISWSITEAQGPSVNTVVVKVTDNGSPVLSHTNQFTLTVLEVNSPPVATAVLTQIVDSSTPMSLQLTATDPDLPANTLTFERLSGPSGLTISAAGLAQWVPSAAQIPSTNTVVYRVVDNGSPSLSATNQFTVIAREGTIRYVWQVGDIEESTGTVAYDEFSNHNSNDAPPGTVWRVPGDPLFNPSATYVADDDFYTAGIYPAGFNGLTSLLSVAMDENTLAWERSVTGSDRTNRLHFILAQSQIVGSAALRVTYEITSGWSNLNNVALGWGTADIVVNFRNGNGVVTPLATNRFTDVETVSFVFQATSVQATLGPNTLEWVCITPVGSGGSIGRTFDYVLVEADSSGNPPPVPVAVSTPTIDEMALYTRTLTATDASVPAQELFYDLISGPAGLTVALNGVLSWTPDESQGPGTYAVSVRVTDSGSPPGSATNNFSITVREVNTPPVPVAPTDLAIPESAAWTFNSIAIDSDIPANTLTYSKLSGPSALTVSAAGVLSWTPTELDGPGTYPVSIRIADNGSPAMGATNSFVITVLEVNTAPVLIAPANLNAIELSPYTATLGASDPDLPPNGHTFTLLSGPAGLTLSPAGVIAWTPTEAQGPQNHIVTVVVTDIPASGVPPLSTTNSFVIAVAETNAPPVFNPVANQTLDELTALNLTLTASDPDLPANTLTFSLISGPEGLTVATGGQVAWTPSESQGPSTNTVTVKVTDNGVPALSATNVFTIVVREINTAPTTTPLTPSPTDEMAAWSLQVPAQDSDLPPNVLTYSLITSPAGATITAGGLIQWTPPESAGPGTHAFAVRIQDDSSPQLSVTNTFTLEVREVNLAPTLAVPPTQVLDGVNPLSISLSATDPDIPANALAYGLVNGPIGLTVSPAGLVEWMPPAAYSNSTNLVTVKVTDNGSPALSHTNSFQVVVAPTSTRLLWEIGVDDDAGSPPFVPDGEFGVANGLTDPAPGSVTRLPGDPLYNAGSNPPADDHFYFAGTYPAGYNGLSSNLQVPNDEPASAWEGRLTTADPSNRFHFLLNSAQVALNAHLQLTVQLPSGGSSVGGTPTGSFSDHRVVIRFLNTSGAATVVYSNLISAETTIFLDLPAPSVAATAGPNAIEIERVGPSAANTLHWLVFDYIRLESVFDANTPPILQGLPDSQVDELTLFTLNLSALDAETPSANLLFSLDSGPDGVVV
ncbi:MAG: putative Ig domain-containing protein, partial [Verrucomicrobiae bacterium]|nr:putative Ig domain-containing protein [Verrucomicrobiae bacterium]